MPTPKIVVPQQTDVNFDLKASVDFIQQSGHFDVPALVSFTANQYNLINVASGTASAVVPGGSGLAVTLTVALDKPWLSGVQAAGDGNASFLLYINGVQKFRFVTNIVKPEVDWQSPEPIGLSPGDTITIYAYNTGDTTGDFSATLLGNF